MIEVELFDGTTIQFPEGTSQDVINRVAQAETQRIRNASGGVSADADAVDELGQKIRATGRGFSNMGSYGLADEGSAALGATLGLTPGSAPFAYEGTWRERYETNRDAVRGRQDESRETEPLAYGSGQVLGGAAQALATAPAATAQGLFGTMGRGMVLGGVEGSLYSAGQSDGEDTLANAGRGAAVGGMIGLLAPAAVAGGARAKDIALGGVDSALDRASQARANRSIAEVVRRSGQSPDDIASRVAAAQADGQPMYRAVDAIGDAGRRRLSGVVRSGGDNSQEIAEYLAQRTTDAPDRLAGFTDEAFGLEGKTRQILEGEVKGNRKRVADALYARAAQDARPVDVRGAVSILDDTIRQMDGSGMAPPALVEEMQRLRSKLAGQTARGEPTTLSDYNSVRQIWQELRDDIDNMYQPGSRKTGIAEGLKPVRDALEQSLSESSDLFRTANDLYRRGSRVLEGFETGSDAARRAGRAEDNIRRFDGMTEQEQRAFRMGYGDETIRRIEGMNAEAPNVSRQMASSKRRAEADAFALDPEQYAARLGRERDMFKTYNTALGGSRTADNLNDMADVGALADLSRAGVDATAGNSAGVVGNLFSAVRPFLTGQNEATQQLVARALLSTDPRGALRQAERAGQISQTLRRVIEGLMRTGGRMAATPD